MFFFFESDQEKRVREDIEKNLQICMSNPKKYEGSKQVIEMHISSSNQKAIEQVVDYVKATIKDEDLQPIRKYQAILLLRDLMRTHNKALGKYVVKKALKRLTILAQHKNGTPEEADDKRGRDIFGKVKRDQETYSIQFLNTLLSALEQWGTTWPKAPDGPYKDFHRQYNELVMNKVKFPKERPKQPLKQVSRSLSPVQTGKSIEKPPPSTKEAPSRINRKESIPENKPVMKPGLERQLQNFYDQMLESIQLFGSFLEESDLDGFPVLRQISTQMNKNSDKGNQLVVELEDEGQNSLHRRKIQAIFDFITDLNKDMSKVAKKGELFEKFKRIFIKKVNQTVKILQEKEKKKEIKKQESIPQRQSGSSVPKEQPTPQVTEPQIERPKIKNQNRYTSVSGGQILEQFQPNQSQIKDPKESSLNSDRFGSFGGPTSQRHGATITLDSPVVDKKKRDEKICPGTKNDSPPPIPKRKTKQLQKETKQNQNEKQKGPAASSNRLSLQENMKPIQQEKKMPQRQVIHEKPEQPLNKSDDFFKEFNKQSSKNVPEAQVANPFKDNNDSFGNFGASASVKKDGDDDFFAGMSNRQVPANNLKNLQTRRRAPVKQASEKDLFQNKRASHISDGLSAFQIQGPGQSSKLSGNKQSKKNIEQLESKKSIVFDNPFGTEADPAQSKVSQRKSLDFFNDFENRSEKQAMPNNLMIAVENPQESERGQNPFATGNFGGLVNGERSRKSSINPFETESYHSATSRKKTYISTNNPFQQASFERKSRGSQASGSNPFEKKTDQPSNPFQSSDPTSNPFEKSISPYQIKVEQPSQSNIFESKTSQPSNPFEAGTEQNNITNPFDTKIHNTNPFESQIRRSDDGKSGIESIVDIFRPPPKIEVEDIQQRGGFKKAKGPATEIGVAPNQSQRRPEQHIRQSFAFTVNMQKEPEDGLNFSQFQDIPGKESKERRESNEQNQSGFSLSNFNNIGNDPFAIRNSEMNNTKDFFAGFENKQSINSKTSEQQKKNKDPENLNKSNDFFAEFNVSNSKSKPSVEKKQIPKNVVDGEKTVKSHSQKSFNFSDMSGMQKKEKDSGDKFEVKFQDFGNLGNNSAGDVKNNSSADPWNQKASIDRKDSKIEVLVDNDSKSDGSVKWGQFDRKQNEKGSDHKNQFEQFKSNLLGMQSRNGEKFLQGHGLVSDRSLGSRISKEKQEPSLDLGIEDFIPLSQAKKGIHWDPLSKIPNLKPPSFIYMVDDEKVKSKKAELSTRKLQYTEAVKVFKQAKEKNNQIKHKLLQKMTKVDEVLTQKGEYQHILKKIKQSNDIKEKQITEMNQKIKKVEQLKAKIIQKQKQLYEITKQQIKIEDQKMPIQRTMASKWQLFNKNLQNKRSSAFNATRISYQGY